MKLKPSASMLFAIGAAYLAVAACATSSSDEATSDASATASARTSGNTNACIPNRGIRDFNSLDDRNLIIYGPGNRPYHVILATPSIYLESEIRLGVLDGGGAGADGRICPFGGDAILVDGPLAERIPIRSIERIDATRVESLRIQFGQIEAAEDSEVTVIDIDPED